MRHFIKSGSPFLFGYEIAWTISLPIIQTISGLNNLIKKIFRFGFLPSHWHVTQRINPKVEGGGQALPKSCLWLHGASLGECKGLWALVQTLIDSHFNLVLTSNTHSGLEFLSQQGRLFFAQYPKAMGWIQISIAPFDHPRLVQKFIYQHQVTGLGLYESEIWPHYILKCAALKIPVILIAARMSEKAANIYRKFPKARQVILKRIDWIQTQGIRDRERFLELGAGSIASGFDFKAAYFLRQGQKSPHSIKSSQSLSASPPWHSRNRLAFISLHFQELRYLKPELPSLMERFDLTLIPRHLHELPRFQKLLDSLGLEKKFSLASQAAVNPNIRHILVDTMGQVPSILINCQIAFVGGSLIPVGCHNLWEPLLAGLKIYFGRYFGNQQELALALMERGIGEAIMEISQVRTWKNPGPEIGLACAKFVQERELVLEKALQECRERIIATLSPGH